METDSPDLARWFLLFIFLSLAILVLPVLLLRKAVSEVIGIFRAKHSLCSEVPKSIEELGLKTRGISDLLFRMGDYRLSALQLLTKTGAVRLTEGGMMCLLEEKLNELHML